MEVRRPGTTYWISCVSQKRTKAAPAKDLHVSPWFSKARRFVEQRGGPWFVLSAKYGLVSPEDVIDPYELTLNTMGVADRKRWAERVLEQVPEKAAGARPVVLLAGRAIASTSRRGSGRWASKCKCPWRACGSASS